MAKDTTPLIKCRVRPHNRYGGKLPGELVEVDERELRRCKHALISLADEAAESAKAAEEAKRSSESQEMLRSFRTNARNARRIAEEAIALRHAEARRRENEVARLASQPKAG